MMETSCLDSFGVVGAMRPSMRGTGLVIAKDCGSTDSQTGLCMYRDKSCAVLATCFSVKIEEKSMNG